MANGVLDSVGPNPLVTAFPAVDTFTIANFTMPGKWTLVSAAKKFGWQIQKGYALSGAFVLPTGDELVQPKFRGEFWSSSDFNIYKNLRKQLFQKAVYFIGGVLTTAAMGIDHPELKALGVTSVVVDTVNPVTDQGGGHWVTELTFLQYRPPLPAVPKPKVVIPDVAPPVPTAQNARQVEIQKLTAEVNRLKGA